MFIIFFLVSQAFSETFDLRSLKAKTYTRDNTYCLLGGKRLEIEIRSEAPHTEPKEKNYGEYVLYYPKVKKKGTLLPLGEDKLNSYRLFAGRGTKCSKSYGYSLDSKKLAVLFLKENRPFMDKLSLQIFNSDSAAPESIIETDYKSDLTVGIDNGFIFRTYADRQGLEMGTVKINDVEFFFQDRDFPIWMKYTLQGFEVTPSESFQRYPWKQYFKTEKEFLESAGWTDTEKKFKNTVQYIAVNHKGKKECVLLMPQKTKLSGSETWRCN